MPALPRIAETDPPATAPLPHVFPVSLGIAQESGPAPAPAAGPTEAQIQALRRKQLDDVLTGPNGTLLARYGRLACADSDMVADTIKARVSHPDVADASDDCIASLQRDAKDGNLYRLYADLLERHAEARADRLYSSGQSNPDTNKVRDKAGSLPQKVIDAIHNGSNQVNLGEIDPLLAGETLPVTSGLAFDVGFTAAWLNQGANAPGEIADPAAFKAAAETCFAQKGDDKRCLVMGYVKGAKQYLESRRAAER